MTINEKESETSSSNDEHAVNCAPEFFGLILGAINDFLGTRIKKLPSDLLFSGFGLNGKKAFGDVLRSSVHEGPLRDFLLVELSLNHSCVVQGNELFVFVPALNTRDIAEALGSYVHYSRMRNKENGLFLANHKEFFYDEVLQRAIGYIFSKIISHHRDCLTPAGCKKILDEKWSHSVQSHERDRASLFLQYSEAEDRVLSTDVHPTLDFFNLSSSPRFQLTRCIGYCLGEGMFNAMIRDELTIEEFKAIVGYDPRRQSTIQLYSQLRERYSR